MAIGLVGQKCGMTRVFNEDGSHVPVSVIKIDPNRITQVKNIETDGYSAIQVTTGKRKQSKVSKPQAGHYAKAGTEAGLGLWEFRTEEGQTSLTIGEGEIELTPGKEISVDYFSVGQIVDVSGTSKGKGFAGTIKRHNFRGQDATHGNSLSHRVPGSTGQNQTPGRVFKGKKMAGQMGNVKKTIQNLEVIKVDVERNLLLVKGSVPGATSGYLVVKPAVKSQSEEK